MREIKFRAWDKKYEVMIPQSGSSCGDFWYPIGFQMRYHEIEYSSLDCILMQYTGIKDKEGVEIYEGDILKITYQNGATGIGTISYKEASFCVSIKYSSGKACLEHLDHFNDSVNFEVIGNIHENKELLNN